MGYIPFLPFILDQKQPRSLQSDPGNHTQGAAAGKELQGIQMQGKSRYFRHQLPSLICQPQIPGSKSQIRTHFHGFHLQLSIEIFSGRIFHQGNGPFQPCRKDHLPQDQIEQDQDPSQDCQPFFSIGTHEGLHIVHRASWVVRRGIHHHAAHGPPSLKRADIKEGGQPMFSSCGIIDLAIR